MLIQIIRLMRPLNVLITGLSVLVAASLSIKFELSVSVVLAMSAAALIAGAANIVNDIFDIEIDRVNKPQRALAAGLISKRAAWSAYIFLHVLAGICAAAISLFFLAITIGVAALLYVYSCCFKRKILIGNLTVSLVAGITFIYGAMAVNDLYAGVVPALFAFLFHLGRELIKDLEDVVGDLALNAVTFAGKFGIRKTLVLVNAVFLALILLLFSPFVLNQYNIYYIYIVAPGVAVILLIISVLLWFKNDNQWLGRISLLLKADMFVGLLAIYIGARHDLFINY